MKGYKKKLTISLEIISKLKLRNNINNLSTPLDAQESSRIFTKDINVSGHWLILFWVCFFYFSLHSRPTHTQQQPFASSTVCQVIKRNFSNFSCAELPSQTIARQERWPNIMSHCLSQLPWLWIQMCTVCERRIIAQLLKVVVRRESLSAASNISFIYLTNICSALTLSRHSVGLWEFSDDQRVLLSVHQHLRSRGGDQH